MTPLRAARLRAGLTQQGLASAAGVGQARLQEWESGAAEIPRAALARLAQALEMDDEQLLAGQAYDWELPIRRSSQPDSQYFGEVTIHFTQGVPLLLPVSCGARERLRVDLERGQAYSIVDSIDNRVVAIHLSAISDLFFSSEEGEEAGPEGERYESGPGVYPEDGFWQTVEQLYSGELAELDELALPERSVADILWPGTGDTRGLGDDSLRHSDEHTQRFFGHATETVWQCASGFRRAVWMHDDANLLRVMEGLSTWDESMRNLVRLPVDEYQVVQVNPRQLDYLTVPGHRLRRACARPV